MKIVNDPWIEFGGKFFGAGALGALPVPPNFDHEERAIFGMTYDEAFNALPADFSDPGFGDDHPAYDNFGAIQEWRDTHPSWIAYNAACSAAEAADEAKTFVGAGLARPGTEIEVGGAHYLLGDVTSRGSWGFASDDIVTRYRVLLVKDD